MASVGFAFHEVRQVVSGQLPHRKLQCTMGGRKGRPTEDEMDKSVHEREQISLTEFPGSVYFRESREGRPVWKFDGSLKTPSVSLSKVSDSSALR